MRIYLATWFEDARGRHLTLAAAKRRLTSYFKLSSDGFVLEHFEQYVATGVMPATKEEAKNANQSR